jgi:glyoxylase-like metal-dependent hydrolase (beta-lactamase superfamily II)
MINIGDAEIRRVEEMTIQSSVINVTQDRALIEAHRHWLAPHFLGADDKWTNTFQSFILAVDGRIVVIDPCTGNGRPHPMPQFDRLDTPYIERFSAAGVRPNEVDFVFCTHLHHDHCGWNTVLRDGRYVPTFPNARYLLARREVERWDPRRAGYQGYVWNDGVFERSVLPVLEAGLAEIIDERHRVSPSLVIEPALGHTLGHAMLHLASKAKEAFFSGDVFHHPLQLVRAELQYGPADDLDQAIASRRRIVELSIARDALIIPAHLPAPHALRARRQNGVIGFEVPAISW